MDSKQLEEKAHKTISTVLGAVYDGIVSPTGDIKIFITFIVETVLYCMVGEQATRIFGVDVEYLVNYLLGYSVLFIKYLPNELSDIVSAYHGAGLCIRVFEKRFYKQLETISTLMSFYKISPPSLLTYGGYLYNFDSYVLFNHAESAKINGDINVMIRSQDN